MSDVRSLSNDIDIDIHSNVNVLEVLDCKLRWCRDQKQMTQCTLPNAATGKGLYVLSKNDADSIRSLSINTDFNINVTVQGIRL